MEHIIQEVVSTAGNVANEAHKVVGDVVQQVMSHTNMKSISRGEAPSEEDTTPTESSPSSHTNMKTISRDRDVVMPVKKTPLTGADTLGEAPPKSKEELDAEWVAEFKENTKNRTEGLKGANENKNFRSRQYIESSHALYLQTRQPEEKEEVAKMLNDLFLTAKEEDNFRVEQTHKGSEATATDPATTSSYGIKGEMEVDEEMLHQAVRYYKVNILPSIKANPSSKGWSPEERARRVRVAINTGKRASLKAGYDPSTMLGSIYAEDSKNGYGMMAGLIHNRITEYNEIGYSKKGKANPPIISYKITEDAKGAAKVTYTLDKKDKEGKPLTLSRQGKLMKPVHKDSSNARVNIDIPVAGGFPYKEANKTRVNSIMSEIQKLTVRLSDPDGKTKEMKAKLTAKRDRLRAQYTRFGGR